MTLTVGLGTNVASSPGRESKIAMPLAWATDIHPNFLTTMARRRFLKSVNEQADALVVTSDIAESNSVGEILAKLRQKGRHG